MLIGKIAQCALLILGAVKAAPVEPVSRSGSPLVVRDYTNAERIAMGLGVNKPARLFDPSKSTDAPHAKRSGLPEGVATGNIAFTTPNQSLKRALGSVSYATVVDGQFQLTPDANSASLFGLPNFSNGASMSGAFWIPAEDVGEFIARQAYAMFASLLNGIASLGFGNPPAGSYTNIFAPPTYSGGLSPVLPAAASSSQQYIWVTDASGALHLASDLATAQQMFEGVQSLLPVVVQPGATPDFTEAIEASNEALVNPTRLWATSWTFEKSGYVRLDGSGGLAMGQGEATTFYLPNQSSDYPPLKLVAQVDGQTVTVSATTGELEPLTSSVGSGVDNLRLDLPQGQEVILSLDIDQTPNFLILADDETGELYSATPDGFGLSTKKSRVCMELVALDGQPSKCQAFIEMINDATYGTRPTNVYVSTSSGDVAGYLNTETDGSYSIGTSGGRFFDGSNSQGLWSKVGANYLTMSAPNVPGDQGIGPLVGILPRVDVTVPAAFVRLPDPSSGIILPPPNIGGDYTVDLTFYIDPASSSIYAFNGPTVAAAFSSSLQELCIERFADGGSPGLCAQKWA